MAAVEQQSPRPRPTSSTIYPDQVSGVPVSPPARSTFCRRAPANLRKVPQKLEGPKSPSDQGNRAHPSTFCVFADRFSQTTRLSHCRHLVCRRVSSLYRHREGTRRGAAWPSAMRCAGYGPTDPRCGAIPLTPFRRIRWNRRSAYTAVPELLRHARRHLVPLFSLLFSLSPLAQSQRFVAFLSGTGADRFPCTPGATTTLLRDRVGAAWVPCVAVGTMPAQDEISRRHESPLVRRRTS